VQLLRADGYEIRGVLAVVDRRIERHSILRDGSPIRSLYTLDDFADLVG
jgi:orotate phosphoribosyltransferase